MGMRRAFAVVLLCVVACASSAAKAPSAQVVRRPYRTKGDPVSCEGRVLLEKGHPSPQDIAFAQSKLRELCEKDRAAAARWPNDRGLRDDRTCTCGQYGIALLDDPEHRHDLEAIT